MDRVTAGRVSLVPEPMEEAEVQAQLDDIDVDAPRVGIVMGSKSDMEAMEKAAKELKERGILHEMRVMSAHREPDLVAEYAKNARMRGLRVIIAGAGISAALPGAVAAHTDLPVIGVPLSGRLTAAGGLDAILSIVQMPPGVPVACVGLDNARNAAILAAQILGMIRATPAPSSARCGPTRRAWRRGGGSRWRPARSCPGCSERARDRPPAELEAIRGGDVHGGGGRRARARHRSRRRGVRRRAGRVAPARRGAGSTSG